jgi:hypothetical protein
MGHEVPAAMNLRVADAVAAHRAPPPLGVMRHSGDHVDLMALPGKVLGEPGRIGRDSGEFRSVIDSADEDP